MREAKPHLNDEQCVMQNRNPTLAALLTFSHLYTIDDDAGRSFLNINLVGPVGSPDENRLYVHLNRTIPLSSGQHLPLFEFFDG